MKHYITPATAQWKLQGKTELLSGSPSIDPNEKVDNPSLFDAKGNDFYGDDNVDPTPQTFNVWED
jgi:hypothetical protein